MTRRSSGRPLRRRRRDPTFTISLNGKKITHKTSRSWRTRRSSCGRSANTTTRSSRTWTDFSENPDDHEIKEIEITGVRGFIASVEKPNDLKIFSTDERVGIDLFVNGRLRERDILKHIPTARIVESYMYGQIHFDELDDSKDRFTSSREGIVADDPKYSKFLETFRKEILKIVAEWDELRVKHREEGDPENPRLTKKQRASLGLFGAVSKEYASEGIEEKEGEGCRLGRRPQRRRGV